MKLSLHIGLFLAIGISFSCVAAEQLIFESNFQNAISKKINASALQVLEKKGLSPARLEKILLPKDLSMDWGAFPADGSFECKEGGFLISTDKKIIVYGPHINVVGQKGRMELTLKNLSDKPSAVDFGAYEYMLRPGPHSFAKLDLTNQETLKISFNFAIEDQFSDVVPRIAIQGKVLLQELKVFTERDLQITVVEGEITDRSILPDPSQSDYPDCRFTVHFQGNSILYGVPCKEELALVIDGFKNYRWLKSNNLKVGDKVRCAILPFEDLPDAKKTTQQVDDLNLFALDNYYVMSICKIAQYSDEKMYPMSGITFLDTNNNYVSIFERQINPPIPKGLVEAQQRQIAVDLEKMNKLLDGWEPQRDKLNKKFNAAWESEKAKDVPGYNRINNKLVWRNIDNSFWCLPCDYQLIENIQTISEDKLTAIVALKDVLEANGCQLIVSLVPNLYVIAARVINPDFRSVPDYQTATIVKQLSEAGIESIYASETIINNYNRFPWAFFFPSNAHPSDTTQDILSDLIALRLQRYNFHETLNADELSIEQHSHVYGENKDYFWPTNCDIGNNTPATPYKNNCVMYQGKILTDDPQSPVLILGNSYIQTPMKSPDSLCTLLGKKMRMGIANYRIEGAGPMTVIAQNIFSRPEVFLQNRKVIILQFGTSQFLSTIRWNNLALMDRFQLLLQGKKLISTINVCGENPTESVKSGKNQKLLATWEKLEGKNEFCCTTSNKNQIIVKLDLSSYEKEKDIICVIPSAVFPYDSVVLSMTDDSQTIPAYYSTIRWQNVFFIIPAGTQSAVLKAQGTQNRDAEKGK